MSNSKLFLALTALNLLAACGVDGVGTDDVGMTSDELKVSKGKFETLQGRDGKFYFHLLAGNGERVLASQSYTTRQSAEVGIESVKANGVDASRYLLRETEDGSAYFVVIAKNGEIIGVSEIYESTSNANRAIASVVNVVKTTVARGPVLPGNAKFETFKGIDGRYYFHLQAGNGEIVLQSQGYTAKASALNGIDSVAQNGGIASRYHVLGAADGRSYLVVKAANGQVIAWSETYESASAAKASAASLVELLKGSIER